MNPASVRRGLVAGALLAFVLVAYGLVRIPSVFTASPTGIQSVCGATVILIAYAVLGWFWIPRLARRNESIVRTASVAGLLAGTVFTVEIFLEYAILPENNTSFGLIEFGMVFASFAIASGVTTYRSRSWRTGVATAVATSLISSLIWIIAVLFAFYLFYGTGRQDAVLRAEGNYEDFAHSGMTDFHAFIMEDFLGACFYHLLMAPLLFATVLGGIGAAIGAAAKRIVNGKSRQLDGSTGQV